MLFRSYLPVLVRGKESEGVKFWGFGKKVYTELLGFMADPDYGDITDLNSGRDITVEFIPAEGAERFPKTSIRVKPNQTPATEDKNVADGILTGQRDVFDIFKKVSYDDLKGALENWLNPEDEGTEEPVASESANLTSDVTKTEDINAAFDDLFNQ